MSSRELDRRSRDSRSRSPANSNSKSRSRSLSRSKSRSRSPRRRSRSASYSPKRKRSYSRSYSRSRSRSYSRSRSPYRRRRSYSPRRYRSRRSNFDRSPMSSRRRHVGNRYNPPPNHVIGVFGLSLYTNEKDLREIFDKFGEIREVQVVYDHQTGRSRGFSFVYYENIDDAIEAKEQCNGIEVDGRKIRVDYSITKRAHTPTPGVYMGKPTTKRDSRDRYHDDYDRDRDRGDRGDRGDRDRYGSSRYY